MVDASLLAGRLFGFGGDFPGSSRVESARTRHSWGCGDRNLKEVVEVMIRS